MRRALMIVGSAVLILALGACTIVEKPIVTPPSDNPPAVTEVTQSMTKSENPNAKSNTPGFLPGFKAIEIVATSIEGETFTLSEHLGKVVVLNFWASWCPPCNEEIPHFNEAFEAIQGTDAIIVGINLIDSDKLEDVKAKIAEMNIVYPNYLDEGSKAANAYRVRSIPTTIIVRPDGVIHDVYVGALNKETLLEKIDEAKQ